MTNDAYLWGHKEKGVTKLFIRLNIKINMIKNQQTKKTWYELIDKSLRYGLCSLADLQ